MGLVAALPRSAPSRSIVATMPTTLPDMTPAKMCPQTEIAQRFLASAYDSVNGVLTSFDAVRDVRRAKGGSIRGRLPQQEEDLLRSAITFACAGLDSTLKRVIRDALPALLERNTHAHERFEKFVGARIGPGDVADPRRIAQYLVQTDPRGALIDAYIYEMTGMAGRLSASGSTKTRSSLPGASRN